jgi:PIN domain nuclease of toxin-antitoxin system
MRYVIDTHALIWFLEKNPRLGAHATAILSDPESSLVLPAIALAESVWIVERGRTSIPSAQLLLDAVIADPRITIYALDQSVLEQTLNLSAISEMHDRQIVATVIVLQNQGEQAVLLTVDRNITESEYIEIIW